MRQTLIFFIAATLLLGCTPGAPNAPAAQPTPRFSSSPAPTLLISSATPSPQPAASLAPSCKAIKIMPLGDSITYGEGVAAYGGYRNLLGALLESDGILFDFVGSQKSGEGLADPDNEGHPGWRISNLRQAIASENWLETYQPDIILLHIGSNDLRYGNSAYAPGNLSALLDDILARLPETHIIVAQIIRTRWGSDAKHRFYNDSMPNLVALKGAQVSLVDMREVPSKEDFTTLYHPSPVGYDKMAHVWEQAILALTVGGNLCLP
jgi:lysophospholipase L1-like esterase